MFPGMRFKGTPPNQKLEKSNKGCALRPPRYAPKAIATSICLKKGQLQILKTVKPADRNGIYEFMAGRNRQIEKFCPEAEFNYFS